MELAMDTLYHPELTFQEMHPPPAPPPKKGNLACPGINKLSRERLCSRQCVPSPITSSNSTQIHTIKGFTKAIITCTWPSCWWGNILVQQWSKRKCHQSEEVGMACLEWQGLFSTWWLTSPCHFNATVWEGEKEAERKRVGCVCM